MASILHPPPALKLKETKDASLQWNLFKQSWANYEIASGTNEKADSVRVATFLHVAGQDALEKYNGFVWESPEDKLKIETVIKKFDEDCKKSTNILAERFKFLTCKQKRAETCDQFVTKLRTLCATCGYNNPEEALRDQFVLQIRDSGARERLLDIAQADIKKLTFAKAISMVKNMEASRNHNDAVEEAKTDEVLKVQHRRPQNNTLRSDKCQKCGSKHSYKNCPAYGKKCHLCKKFNHFAKMCKVDKENSRKVNRVDDEEVNNMTISSKSSESDSEAVTEEYI